MPPEFDYRFSFSGNGCDSLSHLPRDVSKLRAISDFGVSLSKRGKDNIPALPRCWAKRFLIATHRINVSADFLIKSEKLA